MTQRVREQPRFAQAPERSGVALLAALARLRVRLHGAARAPIAAWVGTLLLATAVGAMLLDALLALSDSTRITLLIAGGMSIAATFAVLWVRLHRHTGPIALAGRLDRVTTPVVRTGVELLGRHPQTHDKRLTDGLAALAVAQAAGAVADSNIDALVAPRSARRPIRLLAIAAVLNLCIAAAAPRLVGTELLRFIDPRGDHPPYSRLVLTLRPASTDVAFGHPLDVAATVANGTPGSVDLVSRSLADGTEHAIPMFRGNDSTWHATVATIREPIECFVRAGDARSKRVAIHVRTLPQVESMQVTLVPPAYARRSTFSGPMPADGLRALAGTRADLRIASNRPLRDGMLTGVSSTPLIAAAGDPTSASAFFVVDRIGEIHIDLVDIDGQHSERAPTIAVMIEPDVAPSVRLTLPPRVSYATPDAIIDAQLDAADDIGLVSVSLDRALNDLPPSPLEFPAAATQRQVTERTALELSPLGLRAGDTIRLSAHAADAFPGAAHLVDSEEAIVHILTPAELDRLLLDRDGAAAIAGRYMTAERLANDALGSDHDAATTQAATSFATRARAAADSIDATAGRRLPLPLDAALTPRLSALADALRSAAGATTQGSDPDAALAKARASLAAAAEAFRHDAVAPLNRLTMILPIAIEQRRLRTIAVDQRTLADRVQQATTQPATADAPRLARDQSALRGRFTASIDRIEAAARAMADTSSVRTAAIAFVGEARRGVVAPAMRLAEARLAAATLSAAIEPSHAAASAMDQLLSDGGALDTAIDASFANDPVTASAARASIDRLASAGSPVASAQSGVDDLHDVGLYGLDLPSGSAIAAGSGGGPPGRRGAAVDRSADPSAAIANFRQRWQYDASGAADPPVPPAYRERVEGYFRRVVDELQGGGQ